MSLVMRLLPDNPVLTKEMRVRMRGARAYWILFGYLGFLSLVLLFSYYALAEQSVDTSGGGASVVAELAARYSSICWSRRCFSCCSSRPPSRAARSRSRTSSARWTC